MQRSWGKAFLGHADTTLGVSFLALCRYPTCMFVLVEHNADVDARDSEGVSALHWAASSGQLEAVRLLIEAGASHSPREIDRDQFTPLDYARIGDPETGQPHEDIIE